MAITDVSKDTVTFVNPWDTSKKYTMNWDEFAKLGIGYMSSSDLSKTNPTENIVDRTDASNYIYKNDSNNGSSGYSYRRRGGRGNDNSSSNGIFNNLINYFEELINELFYSDDKDIKMRKKGKSKVKKH